MWIEGYISATLMLVLRALPGVVLTTAVVGFDNVEYIDKIKIATR